MLCTTSKLMLRLLLLRPGFAAIRPQTPCLSKYQALSVHSEQTVTCFSNKELFSCLYKCKNMPMTFRGNRSTCMHPMVPVRCAIWKKTFRSICVQWYMNIKKRHNGFIIYRHLAKPNLMIHHISQRTMNPNAGESGTSGWLSQLALCNAAEI